MTHSLGDGAGGRRRKPLHNGGPTRRVYDHLVAIVFSCRHKALCNRMDELQHRARWEHIRENLKDILAKIEYISDIDDGESMTNMMIYFITGFERCSVDLKYSKFKENSDSFYLNTDFLDLINLLTTTFKNNSRFKKKFRFLTLGYDNDKFADLTVPDGKWNGNYKIVQGVAKKKDRDGYVSYEVVQMWKTWFYD